MIGYQRIFEQCGTSSMSMFHRPPSNSYRIFDLLDAAALLGVEPLDVSPSSVETPVISGRLLTREIQPGLIALANDTVCLLSQELIMDREACLACSILLGGESDYVEVEPHGRIDKVLERAVIMGGSQPMRCYGHSVAGRTSRGAGFVLKPHFFDRFGEVVNDDGLSMLKSFFDTDFRTDVLARSPKLLEIARRNLDHAYSGALGELFLESNTLAFVIEVAELLKEESRKVALIGRRHYDRAMEARDILDASLVTPPKTLELAQRVGMNVTTLQASFKAVFGTTIFGYVRSQRLLMAQALLTGHERTIAEVGYKVGFSNAAAFSAAYRKYFGHSPRKDVVRD